MPGVFAVLTGTDWTDGGLGTLDPEVMAEDMGGPKGYRTKRPPLAIDRVRYAPDLRSAPLPRRFPKIDLSRHEGQSSIASRLELPAMPGMPGNAGLSCRGTKSSNPFSLQRRVRCEPDFLSLAPPRRHAAFAFTCSCNHGRERGKETPHDIASDLRLTSVPSPGRETCAGGR